VSIRSVTVYLNAAFTKYIRETEKADDRTAKLASRLRDLDEKATHLTRGGLMGSLAALPGLLSPIGAGMVALPGLGFGAAASFGAVAIAANGMGEALKRVHEGDPEKLAEALSKLSASGRDFVAEYQRVKPTLDAMGNSTQNAFFNAWRGDLERLATAYVPTLLDRIPRLAEAMGMLPGEMAEFLTTPAAVASVNKQIDLAIDLSEDWTRLLKAGTGLMLDLANAGTDFNRGFVSGMADGVESIREWVAQRTAVGDMNQLMENGAAILSTLGEIAAEAGDLLFDAMANPALADATQTFLDIIRIGIQVVHGFLNAFADLPGPLQSTLATLVAVGGAVMLLSGQFVRLKAAGLAGLHQLESMGPAGVRAASGLERAAQWAGRAAAALAALQVAGILVAGMQDDLNPKIDAMTFGLERWAKTGKLSGEAARVLGADLKDLDVGLKFLADSDNSRRQTVRVLQESFEALIPGLAGTNTSLTRTRERVQALDQALAGMVQGGQGQMAVDVFNRLAASQAVYGVSVEELRAMLPQYAAAIELAGGATAQLASAKARAAMNAAILNDGLRGAVREAGSLRLAFDRLHGGLIGFDEAAIEAEVAVDRLSESLKRNGKSLDIDTKAGQENKRAIIDGTLAAIDAAQAKYNQTIATQGEEAALRAANGEYQKYIGKLRDAMINAGMKKQAVDALLSAYASMPPLVVAAVTTPGLDAALTKTQRLIELRRQLGSFAAAANYNSGAAYTTGRRWGGVTEHARDGLLRQAGVYTPQYPARYAFAEPATKGEAFIPKSGDYGRSMSILSQAAGWYGASVMPGGSSGGSQTIIHEHRHTITVTGREMLSGFRREIQLSGGDVQLFLGSKRPS
jgi:hypothetical protein